MNFFPKIIEIPSAATARARCASSLPVKYTVYSCVHHGTTDSCQAATVPGIAMWHLRACTRDHAIARTGRTHAAHLVSSERIRTYSMAHESPREGESFRPQPRVEVREEP
jgi:hypothetical protein